jgi:hypothetical protein
MKKKTIILIILSIVIMSGCSALDISEEEWNQLDTIFEYPHYTALFFTIFFSTAFAIIRPKVKDKKATEVSMLLGCSFLFVLGIFLSLYFLPATLIILFFKGSLMGIKVSKATWISEFVDPALKLTLLISLACNFTIAKVFKKKNSFYSHSMHLGIFLFFAYYGSIFIAWILSQVITLVLNFDPEHFKAAINLFSPPYFVSGWLKNISIIGIFIVLLTFISYFVFINDRKERRG